MWSPNQELTIILHFSWKHAPHIHYQYPTKHLCTLVPALLWYPIRINFFKAVLFGINKHYIWCKFSIMTKKIDVDLHLLMMLFRTNLVSNIIIKVPKQAPYPIPNLVQKRCKFNSHFGWERHEKCRSIPSNWN